MSDVSLCSRHLSCSDLRPDCERMNEQTLMMDRQAFDPAAVLAEGLGPPPDLESEEVTWSSTDISRERGGVLEGP